MTVCIIPARLNSSRFPAKLLALAQGKTVLQRTFEQARMCPDFDAVYVATDSDMIEEHIRGLGGQVLRTSPHCQNGTERILDALRAYPELRCASIVVNVQGDHPCTEPSTLSAIVSLLKNDPAAEMATAAFPLQNETDFLSPHIVKCVFDQNYNALYFSRSPIPYHRSGEPIRAFGHVGVYAYRTSFLLQMNGAKTALQTAEDLEQLKALEEGKRIKIALVDEMSPSVDTPQDLVKLEQYLCRSNIFS